MYLQYMFTVNGTGPTVCAARFASVEDWNTYLGEDFRSDSKLMLNVTFSDSTVIFD